MLVLTRKQGQWGASGFVDSPVPHFVAACWVSNSAGVPGREVFSCGR